VSEAPEQEALGGKMTASHAAENPEDTVQVCSIEPAIKLPHDVNPPPCEVPWELQARLLGRPLALSDLADMGIQCDQGVCRYSFGGKEYSLYLQP
jgi:hypothetical protein